MHVLNTLAKILISHACIYVPMQRSLWGSRVLESGRNWEVER